MEPETDLHDLLRKIYYTAGYAQDLEMDEEKDELGEVCHKLAKLLDELNGQHLANHPLQKVKGLFIDQCKCGHSQVGFPDWFKCNKCGFTFGVEAASFVGGRLELRFEKEKKTVRAKVLKTIKT